MTRHIAAFRPRLLAIGALALLTLLSACGGGGGATNPPPPLPLSITTVSLPSGVAGKIYNETLATANAVGAVTWSLSPSSGTLPTGLTLSSAGDLSGTPSSVATFNFTIEATDSDNRTATEPYQVAVYPLLVVTTQSLTSATLDSAFSQTLQATGGVPPYIWSAPGGLPPGV
ncbi:MAG: Ig domain-containing protein, partial [Candidatus Acidiferrales bacterium]